VLYNLGIRAIHLASDIVLADPQLFRSNKIHVLMNIEGFFDVIREVKIMFGEGKPTLLNTVNGWIIGGHFSSGGSSEILQFHLTQQADALHQTLNQF